MQSPVVPNLLAASFVLPMFVVVFMPAMSSATHAKVDGKATFVEAGCARCHSVKTAELEATVAERMRGPDLGMVGTDPDHDAAWVVAVIKQTKELDSGPHRARFRGTDDELNAIAAWVVELK